MEYYTTVVYNCEGREMYETNCLFKTVERACNHLDELIWNDEPDFEPLDREVVKANIDVDSNKVGIYYSSKNTWQTYAVKKMVVTE
jgi:hypothetical protein